MSSASSPSELAIAFANEPGGDTRVELIAEGHAVSRLWVIPFTLRIGAATVRMDGIGGVGTEEEYRHRGYSRRVLEAAVKWMQDGEAVLSMLYGISDFYPKFGYATAGPAHFIELTRLSEAAILPPGWRIRPFAAVDLPALRGLYERSTTRGVGAAVRSSTARSWCKLAAHEEQAADECRMVEDSQGQVRAYAWRARWHWEVEGIEKGEPDALVMAEVMADGPPSADAILAACRQWASEESGKRSEPVKKVILGLPPEGPVADAAMHQQARFVRRFSRCGGSMVRVLSVGRLLQALKPELEARLPAAGSPVSGIFQFRTDIGEATLTVTPEGIRVEGPDQPAGTLPAQSSAGAAPRAGASTDRMVICMPQTALARLALGAFPPGDLLARMEEPPGEEARRLMEVLFPLRHPHMYLPDRF